MSRERGSPINLEEVWTVLAMFARVWTDLSVLGSQVVELEMTDSCEGHCCEEHCKTFLF